MSAATSDNLDPVRNIVLILSGKGGVGKSSVTTQLALSLASAGHKVGVLDVDLTGPSIPRFFGVESAKVRQVEGGWLPVRVWEGGREDLVAQGQVNDNGTGDGGASHRSSGSLDCMSLGFLLSSRDDAVVWRGPKKTAMVRQFLSDVVWGELDYLLVDTPPGTSDEHISLVETLVRIQRERDAAALASTAINGTAVAHKQLAGAVVVTTPQAIAIADVRKELNFCAKTGVRVLGVVENLAGFVCPNCSECTNVFSKAGGEIMAREFGVPFLGSVPIDPMFVRLVEEGRRPKYPRGTVVGGKAFEVEQAEREEMDDEAEQDDASLLDKYADCSLSPLFADFATQVVARVADGV